MKRINFPVLITNFKTYKTAIGKNALKLAKIHESIARKYGITIFIAVQASDIALLAPKLKKVKVIAQHMDAIDYGRNTGFILPEAIKEAGAIGSLINHSEHRLKFWEIQKLIDKCRQLDMISIVCAKNDTEVKKFARLKPVMIAVEPPSLIAGNIAVSEARPGLIKKSVKASGRIPLLCGAGIKKEEDVRKAIKLGSKGILVSSAITKARDVRKVLESFARVLKNETRY